MVQAASVSESNASVNAIAGEIAAVDGRRGVVVKIVLNFRRPVIGELISKFQREAEVIIGLALKLGYQFTYNWSAEIEYNFDYYTSSAINSRDFTRNRIYAGVRLTY